MRRALSVLLLVGSPAAFAHAPSTSYVTADPSLEGTRLTLKLDLRDVALVVGIDADHDGRLTWGELKRVEAPLVTYATKNFRLTSEQGPCATNFRDLAVDKLNGGTFAVLTFVSPCDAASLSLHYDLFFAFDATHRAILRAGDGAAGVLTASERDRPLDFVALGTGEIFKEFVVQGVLHIWRGFDHLLFLITLLIPALFRRAFGETVKFITAFTVAHSMTLMLVTLGVFTLPSRLVESAIALSIIVTALNNVRPLFGEKSWLIAGGFGLLHGCGFASVLSDLGLTKATLLPSLIAFNLGVEFGQLALVALAIPLCYLLRKAKGLHDPMLKWGSALSASVAAVWMAERLFEFKVLPF